MTRIRMRRIGQFSWFIVGKAASQPGTIRVVLLHAQRVDTDSYPAFVILTPKLRQPGSTIMMINSMVLNAESRDGKSDERLTNRSLLWHNAGV